MTGKNCLQNLKKNLSLSNRTQKGHAGIKSPLLSWCITFFFFKFLYILLRNSSEIELSKVYRSSQLFLIRFFIDMHSYLFYDYLLNNKSNIYLCGSRKTFILGKVSVTGCFFNNRTHLHTFPSSCYQHLNISVTILGDLNFNRMQILNWTQKCYPKIIFAESLWSLD